MTSLKRLIWLHRLKAGAGGVIKTITGAVPLVFDALAGEIKSLTQYGLCVQDGTPTPSAPVDIKCNNGALRMVDDELPVGYKRVLGFSMNNNSYWEIEDFPLYGSDTLRFSFDATDACNVIGAYSGSASGNNYSLYVGSSSNYLRYKNGAYNSSVSYNTRYDVEITPTGTSGMKTDSTWTEQTFTTPTNLCIGTTATTASSAKLKGNLYGNIEVVGRAKFVPCERVSDNALGYYDTIGEAFYEPYEGYDGAVSLGYDGSHYRLAVVGDDEILWIDDGNRLPPNAVADVRYPVKGSGSCIASCNVNNGSNVSAVAVHYYRADGTQINYYTLSSYDDSTHRVYKSFSLPNTAAFVSIERKAAYSTATVTELKLSFGSSVTPYVTPQSATAEDLFAVGDLADTQDIISGAVKRKVGVWVLTGEERWAVASTNSDVYYLSSANLPDDYGVVSRFTPVCSHLEGVMSTVSISSMTANTIKTNESSKIVYACVGATYTTKEAWKAWLAAQYAAGTPVIVIYPLAEETTETVTAQALTTSAGANTVNATAEVSPITIEVKYKGAAS